MPPPKKDPGEIMADLKAGADTLREREQAKIRTTRSVEIPTDRDKTLKLERTGDKVEVTYTGFRTPVVALEHLQRAVRELGA